MKITLSSINKLNLFLFTLNSVVFLLIESCFSLPDKVKWITLFLFFIFNFLLILKDKKIVKIFLNPFNLIIIAAVVSWIANASMFVHGYQRFVSLILLMYALYMFASNFLDTKENLEIILKIIYILLAGVTILQIAVLIKNQGEVPSNQFFSFRGFYNNKNYYLLFSLIVMCLSVYFIRRNSVLVLVNAFIFLCSLILVIASGSRAGLICLGFLFLVAPYMFIDPQRISRKYIFFFQICCGLVLIFLSLKFHFTSMERLLGVGNIKYDSAGATGIFRFDYWDLIMPVFREKPLFGWGMNAVYYNVNVLGDITQFHFHNSYLYILGETGLFGVSMYILFFCFSLKKQLKQLFQNMYSNEYILQKILFLIISLMGICAISEGFLFAAGSGTCYFTWLIFYLFISDSFDLEKNISTQGAKFH